LARFQLSFLAEQDFRNIATYTVRAWSVAQSHRYLDALESCCELIAENPQIGRQCESIAPRLRRIEQGKHVIFYRPDGSGVKIVRILHANMDPERNISIIE